MKTRNEDTGVANGETNGAADVNTTERNGSTLGELFAREHSIFPKVVAGFTVPVSAIYSAGHELTELEAKALSNYVVERAASVANSTAERGKWAKYSDSEKLAAIVKYMGEYKLTDGIGDEVFSQSVAERAAQSILMNLNRASWEGKNIPPGKLREGFAPHVAAFLASPDAAVKYRDEMETKVAEILAERYEKRTRASGEDASKGMEGIAF